MDPFLSRLQNYDSDKASELLVGDEVVALVDDDPTIREPISIYFAEKGIKTIEIASGQALLDVFENTNIALALLDIGLPDISGQTILGKIKERRPDTGVLMLTGISDLETAMACMRSGADDYLSKPVQLDEIYHSARKILEKRRLILQNRKYQEDLETANFRIGLMHQLSLKMNSVYLTTVELDEILQAILVGITANEGLRFNRAFLAMLDDKGEQLCGRLAIGPGCREEAQRIWGDLEQKKLDFLGIINEAKECRLDQENSLNLLVKNLMIPVANSDHILIRSTQEKKTINVANGLAHGYNPADLIQFLGTDSFVIVPLFSPRRSLGVIIADNLITHRPITEGHINALELFSSQASLAIEHSQLYRDMKKTIGELEAVNYELDKNKDMLIEAERYSALGQMAAQMVHNIRNPITSIGGVARILAKKITGEEFARYLEVMNKETSRLEDTLEDLFDFVSRTEIFIEKTVFHTLLRKVLVLLQPDLAKQQISLELDNPVPDLEIECDSKQIRKMLVHLLKNAIEAMSEHGSLRIKVSSEDDWLNIAIMDSGKSMPEEYMNKAKEPFFTTKTYGTGMGLTMVDKIVSAHGGNFTMQKLNGGTEVNVHLPLHHQAAEVHENQ